MARNDSSNNGKKFQFQMGWGGIAAIFFSTVCVLLWIFVLGFWAGQRITEKKYAQGAFLQQAQPIAPETASPPSATGSTSSQEPRQVEDTHTGTPSSAVPLEQVAMPTDQLAQEQPVKPELAEPIKPIKPEIKPESIPTKPVVSEKHAITEAKPVAEKPKAPVSAPTVKETKPAQGHEATKKEVKPSTSASDVAKVEEKIKKLEEKKAGALHIEAKSASAETESKSAASGSYYALQVAAFKDKAQAETELKKFESKGLKGRIRTVDLGPEKGTWTRVYVGRYETAEKAKAAQAELASHGHSKPSYIVLLQD